MTGAGYLGRSRPGVALVEVVIAVAVVGALLAVFSLTAGDGRRNASLSGSLNNLKQYAWATSTYAADCDERFWTYSSDLEAAAAQAVDIMQRRSTIGIQPIANWVPHIAYSHLVLADQLNLPLPLAWSVDPADANRLRWHECTKEADPGASFFALPSSERPTDGTQNELRRWMVSSSYTVGPAFISRDQKVGTMLTLQSAMVNHYQFSVGTAPLGDRLMTQVTSPSRKAMVWDEFSRHFGKRVAYYAYPEARVPLLLADGSACVRATSESNPGFYPNTPTQQLPLRFNYAPRSWEPRTLNGSSTELVTGHYQWTRGGLTGNDFGAPEACTGQPECTPP